MLTRQISTGPPEAAQTRNQPCPPTSETRGPSPASPERPVFGLPQDPPYPSEDPPRAERRSGLASGHPHLLRRRSSHEVGAAASLDRRPGAEAGAPARPANDVALVRDSGSERSFRRGARLDPNTSSATWPRTSRTNTLSRSGAASPSAPRRYFGQNTTWHLAENAVLFDERLRTCRECRRTRTASGPAAIRGVALTHG